MRNLSVWLMASTIACLAPAPGAWSADGRVSPDLGEAVAGHEGVTYLDLARMVVPDLAAGAGGYFGGAPVAIRRIDGFGWSGSVGDTAGPVRLTILNYRAVGGDRLAALYQFAPGEDAALALYDLSGPPRLLDAADIALDRSTGFAEPARLAIGPGNDVLLVGSGHFNTSQGYVATTLLAVEGDRIVPIDTVYTLDERGCGYRRTQGLSFAARSEAGGHGPITATIVDSIEAADEQCGKPPPAPVSYTIAVVYRWDGARYKPDSDAFARLAEENEKRF